MYPTISAVGKGCASIVRLLLRRHGADIEGLGTILDFGCGAGRVIRHFSSLKGTTLFGTDINPELTNWCQRNLPFAKFTVNQPHPPSVFHSQTRFQCSLTCLRCRSSAGWRSYHGFSSRAGILS